jgi:hypothetical protein
MSLLNVSALQNVGAGAPNILLNSDGSVTLAVYTNASTPPSPTQAGTLWFTGTALNIRNLANSAWVAAGGGSFLPLAGGTMTGPILSATGSAAAPGLGFSGDSDTGIYSAGAGRISVANNGTNTIEVDATGNVLIGGTLPASPNITLSAAGDVTSTSQNGGQLAGFRNILINGNFSINQRNYVSGTATTSANQYTLDRWKVLVSGQNLAFAASGNGNQITAPAGGVQQVIENVNVGGGTYTISWTGTATAQVNGAAATNGSQVTLPANTQATVTFFSGTVSKAQLEPGTKGTPFEQRLIGTEIMLCQRYFQLFGAGTTWSAGSLSGAGSNQDFRIFAISFPTPMRVAPTLSFTSNGTATGGLVGYMAGSAGGGAAITGDAQGGSGATTLAAVSNSVYDKGIGRLPVGNFSLITWGGVNPPQGANYGCISDFVNLDAEL